MYERLYPIHNIEPRIGTATISERHEKVVLWIDVGERNQQVAVMDNIYSQAEEVVIWLGKDLDSSFVGTSND